MTEETKKKRPDLGIAVPVVNKKTPQSYDLSGNIVVEGKKYKFGTILFYGRKKVSRATRHLL